jgi:hypothetical protein
MTTSLRVSRRSSREQTKKKRTQGTQTDNKRQDWVSLTSSIRSKKKEEKEIKK